MSEDDLVPMDPAEGVQRFLDHRKPGVAKSTLQNDRAMLEIFLEFLLDEREIDNLNDLDGRVVADFVNRRRREVKAITLQKQLSSIRMFLEYMADLEAVEDGLREKVHAPEVVDGAESKDVKVEGSRAMQIVEYLNRFEYASRRHAIVALLWKTGMRMGAARSIDLDDLQPEENAIDIHHRPETETPIKNKRGGERWVWLGPMYYQVLEDYVANNRIDATDDYGRDPLFTSKHGRLSTSAIRDAVYRASHPCMIGGCPHDRIPDECEALGSQNLPSKCPSARGPHAWRRGSITHHLLDGTPVEVVSERMDVSLDILYKHYDARRPDQKMEQRRKFLSDE